jgi:hypothetical protein
MNAIKGVFRNGQFVVPAAPDWPDGCEVLIEPVQEAASAGMREEDWPSTPEALAALLERWDRREPPVLTEEERAEWEAIRRDEKERDKARFAEDAERLRRVWE